MFGKRMQIRGEAGLIQLKPFTLKEISSPRVLKCLGDHSVTQYMILTYSPTKGDEENFYRNVCEDKGSVVWGIYLDKSPLIGTTTIRVESKHYRGSTGFALFDKRYWKRGIAKTAHIARTHYADQHLALKLLESTVVEPNVGSFKALQCVGYFVSGMGIGDHFVNGEYANAYNLTWVHPRYESSFQIPAHLERQAQKGIQIAKETLEKASKLVKYG